MATSGTGGTIGFVAGAAGLFMAVGFGVTAAASFPVIVPALGAAVLIGDGIEGLQTGEKSLLGRMGDGLNLDTEGMARRAKMLVAVPVAVGAAVVQSTVNGVKSLVNPAPQVNIDVDLSQPGAVAALQQELKDLNNPRYDPGKVDGQMGKQTVMAIKEYASDHNIPPAYDGLDVQQTQARVIDSVAAVMMENEPSTKPADLKPMLTKESQKELEQAMKKIEKSMDTTTALSDDLDLRVPAKGGASLASTKDIPAR